MVDALIEALLAVGAFVLNRRRGLDRSRKGRKSRSTIKTTIKAVSAAIEDWPATLRTLDGLVDANQEAVLAECVPAEELPHRLQCWPLDATRSVKLPLAEFAVDHQEWRDNRLAWKQIAHRRR